MSNSRLGVDFLQIGFAGRQACNHDLAGVEPISGISIVEIQIGLTDEIVEDDVRSAFHDVSDEGIHFRPFGLLAEIALAQDLSAAGSDEVAHDPAGFAGPDIVRSYDIYARRMVFEKISGQKQAVLIWNGSEIHCAFGILEPFILGRVAENSRLFVQGSQYRLALA
ncbi:hypothetical protein IT40_04115 [Paracoccus versutus]|nr:hypothetical protein IT40_04115 [Paracoccus versutus]